MAQARSGYIRALDGLRGLAILPVTAYHYIGWNLGQLEPTRGTALLGKLVERGALGVTLFFVLSGYLITGILLDAKGRERWIAAFLARRALRIFPLYYLALIAIFFIAPLLLHRGASELYGTISAHQAYLWTYTSNLFIVSQNDWAWCSASPCAAGLDVNHFWSLAVEEHFYLVWPFLVWLCSRRVLGWAAGLLSLAALGLRVMFLREGGDGLFAAHVFTPCCMDALLLGALPAILLRAPDPALRARVLRFAPALLLAPLLAFAIPKGVARQALEPTFQAIAFAGCVILCAHARAEGKLARLIGCAPLVFIGQISYGLYVLHAPLHQAWKAIAPPEAFARALHSPALGLVVFWIFATALSCAVAYASFRFIEKPILALKNRLPGAREEASAAR